MAKNFNDFNRTSSIFHDLPAFSWQSDTSSMFCTETSNIFDNMKPNVSFVSRTEAFLEEIEYVFTWKLQLVTGTWVTGIVLA